MAFGFLAACLLLGRIVVGPLVRLSTRIDLRGTATVVAIVLTFALAWLASAAGSAMIIGAFAAGLLLRDTPRAHAMEKGVAELGHFFVPIFFVFVGAAVDLRGLNPVDPAARHMLLVAGLLTVAAVVGKVAAGYAPVWFRGNKLAIGVGMIPRGEVGLIFAQMGLSSGAFDVGLFSALTLVVMLTTFLAPPLLKIVYPPRPEGPPPPEAEGLEELVAEP